MAHLSKPLRTMKRIIILLLALIPVATNAQQFDVDTENGIVGWSKVCKSTMSQDEITQQILAYDFLDNIVIHGNMIAADIKPIFLNYEGAGYTRMRSPIYITNYMFTGRILYQFKDGRFKVDVFNMKFVSDSLVYSYLNDCIGEFGFDIAQKLIMQYLNSLTLFTPWNDEW